MNKRERVINAMNCRPVDRPPVGFWFHFPAEKQLGEPCIQAHLDYYNQVDTDIAKLMCEQQGGTISVESVLGKGSTFIIQLPKNAEA